MDSEGRLPGGKDIGAQSSTVGGFTAGGKGCLGSGDGACKLWLAMCASLSDGMEDFLS